MSKLTDLTLSGGLVPSLAPLLPITSLQWLAAYQVGLDCNAEAATEKALKDRGVQLDTECSPQIGTRHAPPQRTK